MLFREFLRIGTVPLRYSYLAKYEGTRLPARAVSNADPDDILPPEAGLALAWSPPRVRARLSILLQLDRRLARIVSRTTEPMLGQMRLAWWRDALGQLPDRRPRGDAVLDGIGEQWRGREAALIALVDGWEVLIGAEQLGTKEAEAFAAGRAAPFARLAEDAKPDAAARAERAGRCWALADAVAAISDPAERSAFLAAAGALGPARGRLPGELRGVAVLEALARRALASGGAPLMAGRGASITALRAAIFLT